MTHPYHWTKELDEIAKRLLPSIEAREKQEKSTLVCTSCWFEEGHAHNCPKNNC